MGRPTPAGSLIRSRSWAGATLGYTALIYLTLPFAPRVWFWLLPRLGLHVSLLIGLVGLGLVAGLVVRGWKVSERNRLGAVVLLVGVGVAYALLLTYYYVQPAPAKKIHLIEYAALAYMAFNAVPLEALGGRAATLAGAYLLAAGALDEGIQAVLPMRFFGIRDVIGNWLGSGLGLLVWVAVSANSPWRRGGSHAV